MTAAPYKTTHALEQLCFEAIAEQQDARLVIKLSSQEDVDFVRSAVCFLTGGTMISRSDRQFESDVYGAHGVRASFDEIDQERLQIIYDVAEQTLTPYELNPYRKLLVRDGLRNLEKRRQRFEASLSAGII